MRGEGDDGRDKEVVRLRSDPTSDSFGRSSIGGGLLLAEGGGGERCVHGGLTERHGQCGRRGRGQD